MNKLWIKLAVTFLTIYLLGILLPAVRISFSYAIISTLLIAIPGWAGDRMVLPHLRNLTAAGLDAIYAFAILWIVALFAPFSTVTFTYLLLAGAVIGGFEYVFHKTIFNWDRYEKGAKI